MEEKDNVYINTGAEEIATANAVESTGRTENTEQASTALGKFKDVDALARAYGCLQAEFTRRSQKLKQLQKQVENFEAEKAENAAAKGVEKLRQNAAARRSEEEKFDEFVSDLERANVRALSIPDETQPDGQEGSVAVNTARDETSADGETLEKSEHVEVRSTTDEKAAQGGLEKSIPTFTQKETEQSFVFQEPSQRSVALSSEELYERAKADEKVRLKLIGEYLSSLGKSGAPLLCGGAGALATPPQKAKSIHEAGNMALLMFKNSGTQA